MPNEKIKDPGKKPEPPKRSTFTSAQAYLKAYDTWQRVTMPKWRAAKAAFQTQQRQATAPKKPIPAPPKTKAPAPKKPAKVATAPKSTIMISKGNRKLEPNEPNPEKYENTKSYLAAYDSWRRITTKKEAAERALKKKKE